MSQSLSSAAITEFSSEVHHAYQEVQTLRGTVRVKTKVVGGTESFPIMGKGQATERTASAADVVPMDITHAKKLALLKDYEAPEYTDIYDAATVNFSEVVELAETIAGAIGRKDDQSIIDAMLTSTNTFVDAAPSVATLTKMSKVLNSKGVPQTDRYIAHDEVFLSAMLDDDKITSNDYAQVQALQAGTIKNFMGFTFNLIASGRAEGGLGGATIAYHKKAVGHAVGIDMDISVDWIPQKSSWLSNGKWKAGSVLIDIEGCVKVTTA